LGDHEFRHFTLGNRYTRSLIIIRMKVSRLITSAALASAICLAGVLPVSAQVTGKIGAGLNAAAKGAGYNPSPTTADQLPIIIGSIISTLLSLVGILLLLYMLYAGFLWMTAGGDKAKVEKATTTIRNTIIGLLIIVLAYALTDYVLTQIGTATSGTTGTQVTPAGS